MESIINKIIIEPEKEHLSTIIFLHGLDQQISPWKEVFENFIKKYFLRTKFVFPQGSLKSIEVKGLKIASPTNAWYSMSGDLGKIQKEIPLEEVDKWVKIDKKELLKSGAEINELIQQEINAGILPQKIIVVGYSQGASMALATGLISSHILGRIVCLAGFLPCYEEILN